MPGEPDTSIWLIIPAYNEAAVIGRVVADLVRRRYKVAVIDDGSTDETGPEAGAAGAVVVTHPINLGQGAALQTGIEFALRPAMLATVRSATPHAPLESWHAIEDI